MPMTQEGGPTLLRKVRDRLEARSDPARPARDSPRIRGRPDAPLRVCGYLSPIELDVCTKDPGRIQNIFDQIGFRAYHPGMVRQLSALMAAAPINADYQFDVFPDGTLGETFALDICFDAVLPKEIPAYFREGKGGKLTELLTAWNVSDSRLETALKMAYAGAIPVNDRLYGYYLRLHWLKIRWTQGELQPAKLYVLAFAGPLS